MSGRRAPHMGHHYPVSPPPRRRRHARQAPPPPPSLPPSLPTLFPESLRPDRRLASFILSVARNVDKICRSTSSTGSKFHHVDSSSCFCLSKISISIPKPCFCSSKINISIPKRCFCLIPQTAFTLWGSYVSNTLSLIHISEPTRPY